MAARTTGETVVDALRQKAFGTDPTEFHERNAERYTQLLGRSKGVLMKTGQMLSFVTLGGAFPAEYRSIYQAALARLQDDAPPMDPVLARSTLEEGLGKRTEDLFSDFDWQPLAAASIGQVHRATTTHGRRVAVKIQYPGVADAIRSDLENTELLATFFQLMAGMVPGLLRLDLRAVAKEVSDRIYEEVDYEQEAENQSTFADLYRGHPFIHVPEVVTELSTARILTQDFVDGRRWRDALNAPKDLRDKWGEVIWRFGIGTLRRYGLFNADPHPGNYLFHDDGSVSFVDFGCVKRFNRDQVEFMKLLVSSAIRGDADGMWRAANSVGLFRPSDNVSKQDLLDWYYDSFEMCRDPQPFTMSPEFVARCIEREYAVMGPGGKMIRRMNSPPDLIFLSRIEMGLMSVIGELRSTSYWGSVEAEYDEGALPETDMGLLDHAFWVRSPQTWAGQ
jgi:predicted unusual protein kinase regulating ubiquinone biosynthesis (AarF/ABC1/UbiB family)